MIILTDLDDTMEDLLPVWLKYLNAAYGTHYTIADATDWDLTKLFPNHDITELLAFLDNPALWDEVQAREGCTHYLTQLLCEGHELYVVTASTLSSLSPKIEHMFNRLFPFIPETHIVVTAEKHLIRGDVLIDDYPYNLQQFPGFRILVNQPWNRIYPAATNHMLRAANWKDIYEIIQSLSPLISKEK